MTRILIAEDEDGLRALYRMWLTGEGYQVVEVVDGEGALEKLRTDSFDLAVIDVVMPRLDGITVVKEIRDAGQRVPVLAISAGTSHLPAGIGLPLSAMFGADEVLYKPFDRSEFLGVVHRLLA